MSDLFSRQEARSLPTFANINMLGKCNARCFFCLGEDIPEHLAGRDDHRLHFGLWPNFERFVDSLVSDGIHKVYLTGQNTDPLLYPHLQELIDYIQSRGLGCGLRTNGALALRNLEAINACKLETGYSIQSLTPETNRQVMGIGIPDWRKILAATERCRVSTVVCRQNVGEFFNIIDLVREFPRVQHTQARRISTETRKEEMLPHLQVYEALADEVHARFPLVREFYGANIYDLNGVEVTFWRTVQTSIGSVNYFTDGTISDEYFVIRGYLKNKRRLAVAP